MRNILYEKRNKSKATPEENSAAVLGSNAHFGTYAVDPNDHTIIFHIELASLPNWASQPEVDAPARAPRVNPTDNSLEMTSARGAGWITHYLAAPDSP